MARKMLYSDKMEGMVDEHLKKKNDKWEKRTVTVSIGGYGTELISMEAKIYYNPTKNAVLIPFPFAVQNSNSDGNEPLHKASVEAIKQHFASLGINNFSISGSLIGKGARERHYVAFYQDHEGKMAVFDSKFSQPSRFLNSADKPTFLEKLWSFLTVPLKYLALVLTGYGKMTKGEFQGQEVAIHRLETQPFFDGVSCGYHSSGAVLAMSDIIDMQPNACTRKQIVTKIVSRKDMDAVAENYLLMKERAPVENFQIVKKASSISSLALLGGKQQIEVLESKDKDAVKVLDLNSMHPTSALTNEQEAPEERASVKP